MSSPEIGPRGEHPLEQREPGGGIGILNQQSTEEVLRFEIGRILG